MYSLAFDTTGAACSIIIARDGCPVNSFSRLMDFGQAETLMPEIKNLLNSAGLRFADLEALFVCVGPGSFTGVRSGISAARTFALARPELKLGGISSFDAYVQTFAEEEIADVNAVIVETRRDDFYVQLFDCHLQKISEPAAMDRASLLAELKSGGRLVSLAGDGVEHFLNQPSGLCLHAVKMFDSLPAEALLKAGLQALRNKKLDYPKPLYLRAPDISQPKVRI